MHHWHCAQSHSKSLLSLSKYDLVCACELYRAIQKVTPQHGRLALTVAGAGTGACPFQLLALSSSPTPLPANIPVPAMPSIVVVLGISCAYVLAHVLHHCQPTSRCHSWTHVTASSTHQSQLQNTNPCLPITASLSMFFALSLTAVAQTQSAQRWLEPMQPHPLDRAC